MSNYKEMRYIFIIAIILFFFTACEKDNFTTAPQIKFKSFSPSNVGTTDDQPGNRTKLHLDITDSEGDIGLIAGQDTSWVYVRNLLTNSMDSFSFPVLGSAAKKDFKAEVEVELFSGVLAGSDLPLEDRPYFDTLHFEVYVRDFAKNKSNVIITEEPFIFYTLP